MPKNEESLKRWGGFNLWCNILTDSELTELKKTDNFKFVYQNLISNIDNYSPALQSLISSFTRQICESPNKEEAFIVIKRWNDFWEINRQLYY